MVCFFFHFFTYVLIVVHLWCSSFLLFLMMRAISIRLICTMSWIMVLTFAHGPWSHEWCQNIMITDVKNNTVIDWCYYSDVEFIHSFSKVSYGISILHVKSRSLVKNWVMISLTFLHRLITKFHSWVLLKHGLLTLLLWTYSIYWWLHFSSKTRNQIEVGCRIVS